MKKNKLKPRQACKFNEPEMYEHPKRCLTHNEWLDKEEFVSCPEAPSMPLSEDKFCELMKVYHNIRDKFYAKKAQFYLVPDYDFEKLLKAVKRMVTHADG